MITPFQTNKIKESLFYELNNSTPETLEIVYYFVQSLRNSVSSTYSTNTENLKNCAGSIDETNGMEMLQCISKEFNKIEGEW